ncbi:hypothetical protein L1049_024557 [Liquidambar formosana]|uniref:Uncharacterized protein n=1 Tax=Liquidambar formosana TaxID=63359 RepID=A0AAP0RV33_LIQFO
MSFTLTSLVPPRGAVTRFAGDVAELGTIRAGTFMKVQVVLNPLETTGEDTLFFDKVQRGAYCDPITDNYLTVLERQAATASPSILKGYGIPSERSSDLLEPYVDSLGDN